MVAWRAVLPALAAIGVACGGAPAREGAGPPPASKRKDIEVEKPAGTFVTLSDPALGFQIDFFRPFERGDTKTREGPRATVSGFTAFAKDKKRAQLLNVQTVEFATGKVPENSGCKVLLPRLFKKAAGDRASCTQVTDVDLLEHDPDGVYSITGDASSCLHIPDAKAVVHVACDQRAPGRIAAFSLLAFADDLSDPINRWFVCSLKLHGDVVTCPWGAR